jgi:hexosaminidase
MIEAATPPFIPAPKRYRKTGSPFYAAVLELHGDPAFLPQLRALRDEVEGAFGATVLAPGSSREEFAYFEKNREEGSELWGGNFRTASAPLLSVSVKKIVSGAVVGSVEGDELCFQAGSYTLRCAPSGIELAALTAEGAAAGAATLLQLLHFGWEGWRFRLASCEIEDYPAMEWRGMMIDSSRHFFSIPALKRILSVAWLYKINRFHWHLTDDQGWRVELLNTPEATESGATRPGQDPNRNGFYRQTEIRDLVAFASERGITVVPELDLPGHVQAVLEGNPELACVRGPQRVRTEWGISEEVLCLGNEGSIQFALTAWDEVCELFPGPYVHIGGDECPTTRWEHCPKCAAKKKELNLKDWVDLQGYFMQTLTEHLERKGKTVFAWDEVMDTAVPNSANVVHWRQWLPDQGTRALAEGRNVVRSPFSPYYFDFVQTDDRTLSPGLAYKVPQASTLRRVYEFDPLEGLLGTGGDGGGRFLGIQGNAWSEYIRDPRRLEYMLFPRLLALMETAWNGRKRPPFEVFLETLKRGHGGSGGASDGTGVIFAHLGINAGPLP